LQKATKSADKISGAIDITGLKTKPNYLSGADAKVINFISSRIWIERYSCNYKIRKNAVAVYTNGNIRCEPAADKSDVDEVTDSSPGCN